jgi:hypothetical protein
MSFIYVYSIVVLAKHNFPLFVAKTLGISPDHKKGIARRIMSGDQRIRKIQERIYVTTQ